MKHGALLPWLLLPFSPPHGLEEPADSTAVALACGCEGGGTQPQWRRFRRAAQSVFTTDFPQRMLNKDDLVHRWLLSFPCPDLRHQRFRGTAALSDCAPGVILLHVACAQRLLLELRFLEAQAQLVEALQALPFAEACLQNAIASSVVDTWPVTALDVHTNYVRLYRALSYYELSPLLVPDLAWRPARNCIVDAECGAGEICSSHRCIASRDDCAPGDESCPAGATCTVQHSPSDSDCVLQLSPLCIVEGALEAFHPRNSCLPSVYPRMIKACSEMGTTLYALQWTSLPYEERLLQEGRLVRDPMRARDNLITALILPVTLRLQSPWHMLHSLVPAYVQAQVDSRYRLLPEQRGALTLILVDQDLDKDRHIWHKVTWTSCCN
mmetsp:Transcript_27324/g.63652  ORF Transcript_27324/g.63652 Transcript_27324/m.63652 type:complete len:382 (-) Transcript_27324:846-1991(-)